VKGRHWSGSKSGSRSGLAPDSDTDSDPDLDAEDEPAPHLSPLASAAQGAVPAVIGAGLAGKLSASRPAFVLIFKLSHYQIPARRDLMYIRSSENTRFPTRSSYGGGGVGGYLSKS